MFCLVPLFLFLSVYYDAMCNTVFGCPIHVYILLV